MDHLTFRHILITSIFETYGRAVKWKALNKPSPARLTERHFIEKIPASGMKAKPQKRCVLPVRKVERERRFTGIQTVKLGCSLLPATSFFTQWTTSDPQ